MVGPSVPLRRDGNGARSLVREGLSGKTCQGRLVREGLSGSQGSASGNSNFSSLFRALLHQDDAFLSEASASPYHLVIFLSVYLLKISLEAGRWWRAPLIPALGRQRPADLCEFQASLVYRVSSRTGSKATEHPVSLLGHFCSFLSFLSLLCPVLTSVPSSVFFFFFERENTQKFSYPHYLSFF